MKDDLIDMPAERDLPAGRAVAIRREILEKIQEKSMVPHTPPKDGRRWLLLVAVALVAAVAIPAVTVLFQSDGTSAYASWSSSPDLVGEAETFELGKSCVEDLKDISTPTQLRPVVAEKRGKFHMVVVASPTHIAACSNTAGQGVATVQETHLDSDTPIHVGGVDYHVGDGETIGLIYGRTTLDAVRVKVTLADGTDVWASHRDGYFAAWWPSNQQVSQISVTDHNKNSTEHKMSLP